MHPWLGSVSSLIPMFEMIGVVEPG